MSHIQLNAISQDNEDSTVPPTTDPKVSTEQTSKRRSFTSPAALEMNNTLPLPKSAKKNPIRARFAGSRFESGEWSVHHPKKSGESIKASFTSPAIQVPINAQRAIELGDEAMIDRALELVQDITEPKSI